jgi:hypothetical protein
MMNIRNLRRTSLSMVACLITLMLPVAPVQAAMIGSEQVISAAQVVQDRERVRVFMQREDVRQALGQQGVNADEALARVDAMTDDEVSLVAGKIDQLPAGGSSVVGALVFIFIVLLITDILGLTKIFPFTRPVR